jgi:CTP synthase (UTP-ammonia lyase)
MMPCQTSLSSRNIGYEAEIVICEVGGTIGDLESGPYLEAIRQFKTKKLE